MKQNFAIKCLLILIALVWQEIQCVGKIKSWQTFQNYGNRDLFNQFTIVFQLEHSLVSSDVIKLILPFSIGDLREYPKIQWYELSELTCVFDYIPNSLQAVQVDYIGSLQEYSLVFNDTSTFMEKNKWYQMHIQSGEFIPSTITDVVIKIGMATYSGIQKSTSILYDQNLELSTIYISPDISNSLDLPESNQVYQKEPLKTNRIKLTIKQAIIESSGRLVIKLSSSQFSFAKTSVCRSISDSSQSNVIEMQTGTYKCTVSTNILELVYFDQPTPNQRIFVLEFDILNSMASDSLELIVYQMEPYTNLVLDRGTKSLYSTTTIALASYEMFLSFGQRPSKIFQLYRSLKEYNVYNTITLKFQPQISTPDTLGQLEIELGTSYFSILQGSVQDNLPNYNPTIQTNCKSVGSKLICSGIGSLSSQTLYQISFKMLINYSYSINIIPSNFLNLSLIQTSSGSSIISSYGINLLEVREGQAKITDANTFAASFNASVMPKFDDALGYLKQLQHDPINPKNKQVIGFIVKDDGSGVGQDDKANKGYIIYTTPKIQTVGTSQACLSKIGAIVCVVDAKTEMTTFRFIGNKNDFLPQSAEKSSMVLLASNVAITSFGQMGGQEIFDFYVQTYSEGLKPSEQDPNFMQKNYLVNAYVFSEVVTKKNVMVEIINYLGPNPSIKIDGYNTISLLKIQTKIEEKDPMMSANYDYPLRVEIFFDSMQFLPLYNSVQQEKISDPYEIQRISCIGEGIKCYSIPSTIYSNPYLSSYNFVALNRIQVQFDSIKSMLSFNDKEILIPFIPAQNALSINMFLVLSHGIKALGMKKPIPYFKQINRSVVTTFRDASTDSGVKNNNYNQVQYDLQNVNLGKVIENFKIKLNYLSTDPVGQLVDPKYIMYTTIWNFTNSFVPTTTLTSFYARVQNNLDLNCIQIQYSISDIQTFGLLCPLTKQDQLIVSLQDTYISLNSIQFPFTYGTELPRSSISIIDKSGNLRSFTYLNSKNKISPSLFTFKGMVPDSVMELQKGLEIVFHIQTNHQLPSNFIFQVSSTDNDKAMNFAPVEIKNGCIINNDISILSFLQISANEIKCKFYNSNEIPQGSIQILVVSISVLKQDLTPQNQVEYTKTLISRLYTSRDVLISKSDRGQKLLYQRQRQYGDSNSKITIDSINILQIRKDSHQISFTLNFLQKDWDDFENLRCDFSSLLKSKPSNAYCEIFDLTNNKENFIQKCYFSDTNLLVTRNLDIKLYPISYSYQYKVVISNIGQNLIFLQSELPNGIFSCASVEPSSNDSILEVNTPIQSIPLNYNLITQQAIGPVNGGMKISKQFTYPGLPGQFQITFLPMSSDEVIWAKNTFFQFSFPSRYISGLSNRDFISCYQNKMIVPCQMIHTHTLQIDSLAQDTKPSSLIFELVGIQEPTTALELDNSGNPKGLFEMQVIDGKNNITLSYFNEYDTSFSKTPLEKIRFLNSSQTDNQTYVNSDFYNFTFILPNDTPQRTKLVLEFPYSYIEIFNNYQPDSCVLRAAKIKDISLQCIAESNRISITSDISNTFILSKNVQYTLSIKGLKNPFTVSRCNSEKVNILVFDESTENKKLLMVSGESQSAARNISLTSETTLNSFNVSKTFVNLVYGVISEEITITINKQQRSQKLIEFSNKFNRYIQINPTVPTIPIGEYSTKFTISVTDPTISGEFIFLISQFSSVSTPVIKDVPPITLNIINPTDSQTIQNTFQIKLPFTHFRIPIGGYSLPLVISLDTYRPQTKLIFNSKVVDLPQNGVSINKGSEITLTSNYYSSYIQLKSDGSVSQLGARGILQLSLSGDNANSFYLVDKLITFEIVQQEQAQQITSSTVSYKDLSIYINPSTLSPISQIIQVLSTQSLTLYYTITSNFTQFNEISLKDIISNLQKGVIQERNYMNQRQTQYGSWTYSGNSGLQDFYINNLYEHTLFLVKIFPLNRQGQFLGQFIGNFTTSSNSGKLLKTIFRFQSAVSIAQQIDLACKLSQYFAINQLFLTTATGIRCDSPPNMIDTKIQNKQIQISALDNPNPQFVSFYFSYNKEDVYNNYNSQIYAQLINQKTTIIQWYAAQISSNRFFQKMLDFQATNNIQTAYPYLVANSTQYIANQKWIYVSNIQLSSNGYVWIMVDTVGNVPPNYLQIRQNLNSQNKAALSNYVSYYNVITSKKVAFNITGLVEKTSYDFFIASTSDDSSDNMSYPPTIFSLTLSTI